MAVDPSLLVRNRLLATVHPNELARVGDIMTIGDFRVGHVITEPREKIAQIIFPIDAVFSIVAESSEGDQIEAGTVGLDGVLGLAPFLGSDSSLLRTMCQVQGTAVVADTARLMALGDGAIAGAARRYAVAFMTMASQGAACNRLHEAEQRAARWLLMVHDRQPDDTFSLTHEFFAMMLGATRPAVTVIAGQLRDAGLIDYGRGSLTVVDRAGLEAMACDCYGIITAEYERSLGSRLRQ